jgi:hypothetical protein
VWKKLPHLKSCDSLAILTDHFLSPSFISASVVTYMEAEHLISNSTEVGETLLVFAVPEEEAAAAAAK